jgi:hypothetical protein
MTDRDIELSSKASINNGFESQQPLLALPPQSSDNAHRQTWFRSPVSFPTPTPKPTTDLSCLRRKSRPDLRVSYIHMAALLGFVINIVISAVLSMDIPLETKGTVIRALNKVVWIQNDLFAWVYLPGFEFEGEGEGKGKM